METTISKFVFLLIYLFFMYFIGSIIFTKGFLLKRDVIPDNSTCRVDFAQYWDGSTHGAEGCWLHRRFNKAVIVLIDALRFDFVAPYAGSQDKPYINKMKTVQSLLHHKPNNARLYRFIADPPTTTLQRLKGLTTGSLPTFVDAGSNFASTEITEDNFIDQMVKLGKKITFLGDDTWTSLFPGRFNRQYPFPSFNVKDLHTVDNGVLGNIYGELRQKDWDVMIAHFLGVDHCGHRYGPNHGVMSEKLAQMDEMILNVTQRLDKDTILFVLGDHGMTQSGDHGGDSNEELEAAMFVYSPAQITASKYDAGNFRTVSQIDFVPTISLLLGAPVPFSNLGTVITDLVNHCSWSKDSHIKEVFHAVEALRVNARQISQYISHYMRISSDLPTQKLMLLQERLHNAENQIQTLVTNMFINNNEENAHQKLHYLENEYKEYMLQVKELCKQMWAKFDVMSMFLGVLVLGVSLLVNLYLVFTSLSLAEEKENSALLIVIMLSFVFVIFSVFQSFYLEDKAVTILAFLLGVGDFVALGIIIQLTRISVKDGEKKPSDTKLPILQKVIMSIKSITVDTCLKVIIVLTKTLNYFSNSFVVFEDEVVLMLLQTCIWYFFVKVAFKVLKEIRSSKEHAKNKSKLLKPETKRSHPYSLLWICLLTMTCSVCVKLSTLFGTKREEQLSEEETYESSSTENSAISNKHVTFFINAVSILVGIYIPRKWLQESGNLNGDSFPTLCARYLMPAAGVATVLHWALQRLPSQMLDSLPVWQQVLLPQTVYCSVIICILAYNISPLLIYILPRKSPQLTVPAYTEGQQRLQNVFRYVKNNWSADGYTGIGGTEGSIPQVFGLGTVFSAGVVYNGMCVLLFVSLLLGEHLAPCVLTAVCSLLCFLEVFRIAVKLCREDDLLVIGLLTLTLFMGNFFYSLGHQATIPAIRFEAAFVGFVGDWNMKIIPAILIHLNMFASELLFTLLVPLLIMWPCTKGFMSDYLSLGPDGRDSHWRGDFVLHENQPVFNHLLRKTFFCLYFYEGAKLVGSIMAAAVHKRHLMVWKIFAPRFVYQAMSSFTIFATAILVVLLMIRVNSALTKWSMKFK